MATTSITDIDVSSTTRRAVRYRLLATLGRGGMADVYLGAASGPAGFNKLVVIKKLRADNDDESLTDMFLDEARVSARFNHPNVVHTYEVDKSDDGYFLVMEYLEGQPLRRLAPALRARDGAVTPAIAAHLIAAALEGLHYVHEMKDYDGSALGVVHRDVSPHNLFVTYSGQVKVLDFGIAKGALNLSGTHSGVIKGKVAYMSPEQVRSCTGAPGDKTVDRRSDIFSAGVVLWELLTGEKLFKGIGNGADALLAVLHGNIQRPSLFAKNIPAELDAIVMKALSRNPDARYATALEMSKALSGFVQRTAPMGPEDVARHITALFAEARETMAKTVQSCMRALTTDPETPVDQIPNVPRSIPSESIRSNVGALVSAPSVRTSSHVSSPPKQRSLVGLSITALVLFGTIGTLLARPDWKNAIKNTVRRPVATEVSMPIVHRPPTTAKQESPVPPQPDLPFHLTLSSDPPEAEVDWGGNVIGQTPLLIDLPVGPQTFILSHDGHFKATVVLNVSDAMADRAETRTVVLTQRPKTRPVVSQAPRSPSRAETPASAVLIDPFADLMAEVAAPSPPVGERTYVEIVSQHPPTAAPPSPSPPPATPTVLPFGPEMTRPTLVSGGDIRYPREAIAANVAGTVISKCTITTEGALQNCRIVKGLPFLDKAVLETLATRRYTPVIYLGKPVSVEYIVSLKVAPPVTLR